MEEKRASRWFELASATEKIRHAAERNGAVQNSVKVLLTSLEALLVIYIGSQMILDKAMTLGMLFAYLMYKNQFSSRALGLVESVNRMSLLRVHGHQVADIVLTEMEAGYSPDFTKPDLRPSIEVRNISFRYSHDGPWIFQNVSFTVGEGEIVAITGPSGCGKSTFIRIMLGLETPETGEIFLGGVPVKSLGVRAARGMFGSVLQDDVLFSGSLLIRIQMNRDARAVRAWQTFMPR
jgi:ATP-binding cassette subfamily B protein RaxB